MLSLSISRSARFRSSYTEGGPDSWTFNSSDCRWCASFVFRPHINRNASIKTTRASIQPCKCFPNCIQWSIYQSCTCITLSVRLFQILNFKRALRNYFRRMHSTIIIQDNNTFHFQSRNVWYNGWPIYFVYCCCPFRLM